MFGEMLLAAPPADLEVSFGEVRCPSRIVAVVIANTGRADERYALRVAGDVQRTELVPAGTTVISRVRLPEDRPTDIAVHTEGASAGSTRRTADCSTAASVPAAPAPKGGPPASAPSASGTGTPAPAEPAAPAEPEPKGGVSPQAPGAVPGAPSVPDAFGGELPDQAPPAPKGTVPGATEAGAPAKGTKGGSVKKEKKAKKRRSAAAGDRWRHAREPVLPMTGISPAFAYTGAGVAVMGGILAWYALLWPGRRTQGFASRERSR